MVNRFTADAVGMAVRMTNGRTEVFCDAIALAGSPVAVTPWQQNLVLLYCDLARYARGMGGFDLADLPWTQDHRQEKEFFLELLDRVSSRTGWDKLHYLPMLDGALDAFQEMLAAFRPHPTPDSRFGDWTVAANPCYLERCARHEVFHGECACRLCDTGIQPSDAPTVWELTSIRMADGILVDRQIRQVPEELVVRMLATIGLPEPCRGGSDISGPHLEPISALINQPLDPRAHHWLGTSVA